MGRHEDAVRARLFIDPDVDEYLDLLGDKALWINRAVRMMKDKIENEEVTLAEMIEYGNPAD